MVVSIISDWVFRRVIKLLLKKNLAQVFATEVDVDQLEVQIENGIVEMRDCLLDPSFLNSKLGCGSLSIDSVFVQKVKVCVEDLCLDLQGVMIKMKQVKSEDRGVHTYAKLEEDTSASTSDQTENLEKGVHAISECMKYLVDHFSMIARDVIVSFYSERGDEMRAKVDFFQLRQVDEVRNVDFSGLSIQMKSNNGNVEAGLDETSGIVRFPTSVSVQDQEETTVSCSLNGPLRVYVCPSFLYTYARIFGNLTMNREQTVGNDARTLHSSILRALNLPMLSEDIKITSDAISNSVDSADDEELIDSMAELMSTLFMSTNESFYFDDSPIEEAETGMACKVHLDIPAAYLTVHQCSVVLPAQEPNLVLPNKDELQIAIKEVSINLEKSTIENIATCCIADIDVSILPADMNTTISRKRSLAIFDLVHESQSRKENDQRSLDVPQHSIPVLSVSNLKVRHKYIGSARSIDVESNDIYAWLNQSIVEQLLDILPFPESQPDPRISLEISLDLDRVWLAIGNFGDAITNKALVVKTDLNKDRTNLGTPSVHFFVKDRLQSVLFCFGEIAGFLVDPLAGTTGSFETNSVKLQLIMQEELIADLSSWTDSSLDISVNPTGYLEVFESSFPMLFVQSDAKPDSRVVHIRVPDMTLTVRNPGSTGLFSGRLRVVDGSFKRDHRTVISAEEIRVVVEVSQPELLCMLLQEADSRQNSNGAGEGVIEVQRLHVALKLRFTVWTEINLDLLCAIFVLRNGRHEIKAVKIDVSCSVDGRSSEVAQICDVNAIIDQKMSCDIGSLLLNIDVFVVRTFLILGKDVSLLLSKCRSNSEKPEPRVDPKKEQRFEEPSEYSTSERQLTTECLGLEKLVIESYVTHRESDISYVGLEVCIQDLAICFQDADIDPAEFDLSLKTSLKDVVFQCDSLSSRGSLTLSSVESWFSSPRQWLREVKCAGSRQSPCRPITLKVEFARVGSELDLCFESSKFELIVHQALLLWIRELPSKFQMDDMFWEDVGNSLEAAEERCTVKCKGFPLHLTFIPSKLNIRNLQHDALTEVLNIMPKWSADLWMTNANVHNAVDLQSAVRTMALLWLEDVRDVQLHRIAVVKFPGYSCMRRLQTRAASWIPSHKERSFEDIVTRFLFEVANHIVSHDEA